MAAQERLNMKKLYVSETEKLACAAAQIHAAKIRGMAEMALAQNAIRSDNTYRKLHNLPPSRLMRIQKTIEDVKRHAPLQDATGWIAQSPPK